METQLLDPRAAILDALRDLFWGAAASDPDSHPEPKPDVPEPKRYPIHPEIPTQPIHPPIPEQPLEEPTETPVEGP